MSISPPTPPPKYLSFAHFLTDLKCTRELRFSLLCRWRFKSSRMWQRADW